MSERSKSEEIVNAFEQHNLLTTDYTGSDEILRDSDSDEEMKGMAREEMREIGAQMTELEEAIKVLMLPTDPLDDRNILLEIRAGTGGSEANIFSGDLYDVYRKYCSAQKWNVKIMDESQGDDGGFKSLTLEISGDRV